MSAPIEPGDLLYLALAGLAARGAIGSDAAMRRI